MIEKKTYETPQLEVFGDIKKITLAGSKTSNDFLVFAKKDDKGKDKDKDKRPPNTGS